LAWEIFHNWERQNFMHPTPGDG